MRLRNKVAVSTGSGATIGRSIALAMAQEGASIVVNGRPNIESAHQTASVVSAATGGTAIAYLCDIADLSSHREPIEAAINAFARLHILVYNAGTQICEPFWKRPVKISMGRIGEMDNIVGAAFLLTSSESNYITGDCGMLLE
jgi:NAD(P)-dependent dehydrogenase (short-subunit alcohol dehydrogenase family)